MHLNMILESKNAPLYSVISKHRQYFDWIADQLEIRLINDWQNVTKQMVHKRNGGSVLQHYDNLLCALQSVYPHTTSWQPWKFVTLLPNSYFGQPKIQLEYLEWLAEKLEVTYLFDWYHKLTQESLLENGGHPFLKYCGGRVVELFQAAYPTITWHAWKFESSMLSHREGKREYVDWLAEHMEIRSVGEWATLSHSNLVQRDLLPAEIKSPQSFYDLLMSVFTDTSWQPWTFGDPVPFWWTIHEQRLEYFECLALEKGIVTLEDFCEITKEEIMQRHGKELLDYFHQSLYVAIMSVYPHIQWYPWIFDKEPIHRVENMWNSVEIQRKYVDWLAEEMKLQDVREWYSVKKADIIVRGGQKLLEYFKASACIAPILEAIYPTTIWHPWLFEELSEEIWHNLETQKDFFEWIGDKLEVMGMEDLYNVSAVDIMEQGGGPLLLNIYGGSVKKAIDTIFPGEISQIWHRNQTRVFWTDIKNQREYFDWIAEQLHLDVPESWYTVNKQSIFQLHGTTLLQKYDGLQDALCAAYPSTSWQPWRFESLPASFWHSKDNCTRYLEWVADELGISKASEWYQVKNSDVSENHGAFLLARYKGMLYKALADIFPKLQLLPWNFVQLPKEYWNDVENQKQFFDYLGRQVDVQTAEDWANVQLSDVIKFGGKDLLRYHGGLLSRALLVVYPNIEAQLKAAFSELKIPMWEHLSLHASYWSEKRNQRAYCDWLAEKISITTIDDWFNVTASVFMENYGGAILSTHSGSPIQVLQAAYPATDWLIWRFRAVTEGFWNEADQHRNFLEWFADHHQFSDMRQWYGVHVNEVVQQGGGRIMNYHNSSLLSALRSNYPDIQWLPWLFEHAPRGHWEDLDNQKEFFDWAAEQLGVMHLNDWYQIKVVDLLRIGGKSVLNNYYSGSVLNTLQTVYPTTDWQMWKFSYMPDRFWNTEQRLRFFETLAEEMNILEDADWNLVRYHDIMKRGGTDLLTMHGSSIRNALKNVYGDIDTKAWLLQPIPDKFWNNLESQRKYFEWVGRKLKILVPDDWYRVRKEEIIDLGGSPVLDHHDGKLFKALVTIFPEISWYPWLQDAVPVDFFGDLRNQRACLTWLELQLQIDRPERWQKVSKQQVIDCGGKCLLQYHNNSLSKILKETYPHMEWPIWLFNEAPESLWETISHHKEFFSWLAEQLDIQDPSDWYRIRNTDVIDAGGSQLLKDYKYSAAVALQEIYLYSSWNPWLFAQPQQDLWDTASNQIAFFVWLEEELNIFNIEDWGQVLKPLIAKKGGSGLLQQYGSLADLLNMIYLQHEWHPWMTDELHEGYWQETDHQVEFWMWLAKKLLIESPESWYAANKNSIAQYGGSEILELYEGSVASSMKFVFPEFDWQPWRVSPLPEHYWKNTQKQKEYLDWLENQLNIVELDDWYDVTRSQISAFHGGSILTYFGNFVQLLKYHYPSHEWAFNRWQDNSGSKAQRFLCKVVQELFPGGTKIVYNHLMPALCYPSTKQPLQLDIWIPEYRLALEYQGIQHYAPISMLGDYASHLSKDLEKKLICTKANITLVQVPYWWDYRAETLAATIHKVCPQAAIKTHSHANPIPMISPM